MHKETKPTAIKKTRERETKMTDYSGVRKKIVFSWNPNAKHECAYDDYYIVIEKKKNSKLTIIIIIAKIKSQNKIRVHVAK